MTRLWPEGQAIDVMQEAGLPTAFIWQGQTHSVSQIARQWRVDVNWWQERTWRTYYKVTTESGLLVVLFQDLATHTWYLQRLYD